MPFLLGAAVLPPAAPAAVPAGTSIVAQATGAQIAVFRSPGAKRPFRVFPNPGEDGVPAVFLVRRRAAGWLNVRLPLRPNGSLGWVRVRTVSLARDPYRVTVSLRRHEITIWRLGIAIAREPAAVGQRGLPTPTGHYYIVELLKQADPRGGYGPYAFGLSAYSTVLFSFGGGPGQIGIHGTNEPRLLGTSASHGCVRVGNALIARLARILPLGTPVDITP